MKIVHVCLSSHVFGEHYAYQDNLLSKAHRKLGHEVIIIAPPYSEFDKKTSRIISVHPERKIIGDGIRLVRLRGAVPCNLNQHLHVFFGFAKVIRELQPDLIFAHGVTPWNYRFLKKYKRQHPEVQIVYDNHGDFNNSCQNKLSYLNVRYFVRHFVVDKIKDTSDHFYGVVPARCDFLHDVYGVPRSKIYLLLMGADEDDMHFEKKDVIRAEIRSRYNVEENDFLIVTGGKVDPLKNIHVLAEAVSRSKYQNIKMLIFGSVREDLKETFERLQSNRIKNIGWIPSSEVYNYFYAADMVMFPGLHSVLWEQAVASQVPCAFSRIKGFEHVDVGGNCVLMDGKTVDYYQDLIEQLYTDKSFYNSLYTQAHSEKTQQFLYKNIAQKVIDDVNMSKS